MNVRSSYVFYFKLLSFSLCVLEEKLSTWLGIYENTIEFNDKIVVVNLYYIRSGSNAHHNSDTVQNLLAIYA